MTSPTDLVVRLRELARRPSPRDVLLAEALRIVAEDLHQRGEYSIGHEYERAASQLVETDGEAR